MSTKKRVRQERRAQKSERRGKINPAVAFMIIVVLAVAAIVLFGYFSGGTPEPPRPGAVWSPEHGHWH